MIEIVFNNLERSELVTELVTDRALSAVARHPGLEHSNLVITIGRQCISDPSRPDLFTVELLIQKGLFDGIVLKAESSNFFEALDEVQRVLPDRLNQMDGSRFSKEKSFHKERS